MFEFYNHHYIRADSSDNVIEGWSDGPHNTRTPTEDDILINDKGGYQFRLIIGGEPTEENPPLYDGDGIPLYRWDGSEVVQRGEEELEADRAAINAAQERRARLAELHRALDDSDWIIVKMQEAELYHPDEVEALKEKYAADIAQREAARKEINELEGESHE